MRVLTPLLVAAAFLALSCEDPEEAPRTPARSESETPSAAKFNVLDEYRALVEASAADEFTATHELKSSGAASDPRFDTKVHIVGYSDGRGQTRTDLTVVVSGPTGADNAPPGEESESSFSLFEDNGRRTLCVTELGVFGIFLRLKPHTCVEGPDQDATSRLPGVGNVLQALDNEDISMERAGQRTVLGVEGRCYSATSNEEPGSIEVCLSERGMLLYAESSGVDDGPTFRVTLVDLSDHVEDSDFDLPYPLRDIPTLEVRNETDVPIFVNGHSEEAGDFVDGDVDIAPDEGGVLRAGLAGDPTSIYLGTYEIPQWHWSCSWDDAKAHEPLVVKDESANCENTSPD